METPMVDLAYDLLKSKGEPMIYRDIMDEIAKMKGFTEEEINQYIAQLYTEVNIDGRFICVGRSLWGLREWYPTEQATDSAVAANVKDDYLEDEIEDDLYEDEEDYDEDARDLDDVDDLDTYHEDEASPFDDDIIGEDLGDDEEQDEEL